MKKVDVIVPVYRGLKETIECIVSAHNSLPEWAQLIVINDCSPEKELTDWLIENKEKYNFDLYENEVNLGFVQTVNFGMKLNEEHDVLLLNSDVEVSGSDWLDRMRNAAYSIEKLASITPFSNNATICSFPHFCEDNELFDGLNVTDIDNTFASLDLDNVLIPVPTGVGFCMYIKRECLNEIGYFDANTFGKGYGEENDWCQRADKKGWINYHQLNVFAYHKGGVSFAEEGDPRKENALNLLSKIHHNYERDVQLFIQKDPACFARNLALLSLIKLTGKAKILLITHNLGGGVKQHISELANHFKNEANFIQLTPKINGASVALSYFSSGQLLKYKHEFSLPRDYTQLLELLKYLSLDRIHVHHTMGLPLPIFSLPNDLSLEFDFTVHDYYLINGNPTLTDIKDRFITSDDLNDIDVASSEKCPIPCSGDEWRSNTQKILSSATRLIFPSKDTFKRFDKYFTLNNPVIAYHPDSYNLTKLPLNDKQAKKKVILILGALSKEKGADVLENVAKNTKDVDFHLLGYSYRPLSNILTHGPYKLDDVYELIADIAPDYIWFPAQWPETYSYTLSIAKRFNSTIIYPNIGAFMERISEEDNAICIPWDLSLSDLCDFFKFEHYEHVINPQAFSVDEYILKDSFYSNGYLSFEKKQKHNIENANLPDLVDFILLASDNIESDSIFKEKILIILWKIRMLPMMTFVSKCIPFRLQRYIKRKLSSKAIHDVIK